MDCCQRNVRNCKPFPKQNTFQGNENIYPTKTGLQPENHRLQKYLEKGISDRSQEATLIRVHRTSQQNIPSPKSSVLCAVQVLLASPKQQPVQAEKPILLIPTIARKGGVRYQNLIEVVA